MCGMPRRAFSNTLRFLKKRETLQTVTYNTYIYTLLARPHGAFQSQFYITKL